MQVGNAILLNYSACGAVEPVLRVMFDCGLHGDAIG